MEDDYTFRTAPHGTIKQKKRYAVPKQFDCPLCDQRGSLVIKMDQKSHKATVRCRACHHPNPSFETAFCRLHKQVDVYYMYYEHILALDKEFYRNRGWTKDEACTTSAPTTARGSLAPTVPLKMVSGSVPSRSCSVATVKKATVKTQYKKKKNPTPSVEPVPSAPATAVPSLAPSMAPPTAPQSLVPTRQNSPATFEPKSSQILGTSTKSVKVVFGEVNKNTTPLKAGTTISTNKRAGKTTTTQKRAGIAS